MKKIFSIHFFLPVIVAGSIILTSCNDNEKKKNEGTKKDSLVVQSEDNGTDKVPETKDGIQEVKYANGQTHMKGEIVQGKRHGDWVSYYENGMKWSEDHYNLGVRDGKSVSYYNNGQIRYIGYYTNNVQSGNWEFYDEAGNLVKTEKFSGE